MYKKLHYQEKLKCMNKQILQFFKTDHFLLSQWKRKIDDQMLYKLLPHVECTQCEKDIVLFMPSFLKEKGLFKDNKQCIILVLSENKLVTAYWCKTPNYLFNKKETPHFQIIY